MRFFFVNYNINIYLVEKKFLIIFIFKFEFNNMIKLFIQYFIHDPIQNIAHRSIHEI